MQHFLVFILEIFILGSAVLDLQWRLGQSPGGIFPCEYCQDAKVTSDSTFIPELLGLTAANRALRESYYEPTMVWSLWRISLVRRDIKNRALDRYIRRMILASPCIVWSISCCSPGRRMAIWNRIPSHFASSSTLIGSSFGGLSLGGSLGSKLRVPSCAGICDGITNGSWRALACSSVI